MREGKELAIIIRAGFHKEGIEFFTDSGYSQQLAYMNRPAGHMIDPHVHNKVDRHVYFTLEVLYIKSGKAKLHLYDQEQNYVETRIVETGDVVLLASGGHGLEMIDQTEIIEVKQGPYAGDNDKTRFSHNPDA